MAEDKLEADIDDWMGELSDEENPFDEEARVAMEGPTSTAAVAPSAPPSAPPSAEPMAPAKPIDQSDIDALLGNQEQTPTAAASADEAAGLDQADIDSLFGGAETAMATPAPEMDQDHINQLLGEGETPPPMLEEELISQGIDQALDATLLASKAAPATGEVQAPPLPLEKPARDPAFGEFYQANMDELLGNTGEQRDLDQILGNVTEPTDMASDSPALEQSDLDQLLGADPEPIASAVSTPSQEEMDQLFAKGAGEEEELFSAEPARPVEEEAFGFAGNELDDAGGEESAAEPTFTPFVLADPYEEKTEMAEDNELIAPTEKKKATLPLWLRKGGGRRALWTGAGVSLVLLLGLVGYFTMQASRSKAPDIATAPPPAVVEPVVAPAPIVAANQAPQTMSMEVPIPAAAKEVGVELHGQDLDNDPLEFVITELPTAGKLTGKPPNLTYTPTTDFTGADRFVYRASDGKALSEPAVVSISGAPASQTKTVCAPKTEPASPARVGAADFTMRTLCTAALNIDWRAVWQKANPGVPFSKKVEVEIIDKNLQGTLTRLDARHHRYDPAPCTDGREWLRYRFKLAGNQSKIRQLNIQVQAGEPRPVLALCPLNQQTYAVGDTVVLDASPTRNGRAANLVFSWQQMAGVPVRLKPLNQEGSAVSFMVPSSFYTVDYPQPVIRVTTKDQAGHMDSRDITVQVQANRQAALWNGLR